MDNDQLAGLKELLFQVGATLHLHFGHQGRGDLSECQNIPCQKISNAIDKLNRMIDPMAANKDVCATCHGSGRTTCEACDGSGRADAYGAKWLAFQLARQSCQKPHGDAAHCADCNRVAEILIETSKQR